MMCDKEALVGYIYDELGDTERAAVEQHLAACADCRDELAGLRATRAHLAKWAPPEPDFVLPRFRVVRESEPPRVRRFRVSPAWGLAAAAVLVLAVASAVANLEVKYDKDGFVLRTGWAAPAAAPAAAVPAQPPVAQVSTSDAWKTQMQELDQRLRDLEAVAARQPAGVQAAAASGGRMSDAEWLRQVRAIVSQSETKQQRELALRVAQVVRDFDVQRQADLVRVQQGLQQIQGLTNAELIQHRDALNSLNYLVRVSQQPR